MSKRALAKYLHSLEKEQLEEQILDLYHRFKEVKVYYNFVFNPKEEKLIHECKTKISKEYFPMGKRRPKARRSVAQKYIKLFIQLGVEPSLIADVMLFNIETAQAFSAERVIKQESFFKSMLNSFQQVVEFVSLHGLKQEFGTRLIGISKETKKQEWMNVWAFEQALENIDLELS